MDLIDEVKITRVEGERIFETMDQVVREFPLKIHINGKEIVTLACSPEYLDELAVGYLFSEGIIGDKVEIKDMQIQNDLVVVTLMKSLKAPIMNHHVITSGCGRSNLNGAGLNKVRSKLKVMHNMIYQLSIDLSKYSKVFQDTGGVHGALLTDRNESFQIFREDIGRHNAVDKIIGYQVLNQMTSEDKILVISGRVSSEMILKTARLQIPILVSRSAPTDQAIRLAYGLGITLIGFVRGRRMNIYTHSWRIL